MEFISGEGIIYPSGVHDFPPGFSGVRVAQYLVFCVLFCGSMFDFLCFFSFVHCLVCP
jgi:hypothetical protein